MRVSPHRLSNQPHFASMFVARYSDTYSRGHRNLDQTERDGLLCRLVNECSDEDFRRKQAKDPLRSGYAFKTDSHGNASKVDAFRVYNDFDPTFIGFIKTWLRERTPTWVPHFNENPGDGKTYLKVPNVVTITKEPYEHWDQAPYSAYTSRAVMA